MPLSLPHLHDFVQLMLISSTCLVVAPFLHQNKSFWSHCSGILARKVADYGKMGLENRTGKSLLQKVLLFYHRPFKRDTDLAGLLFVCGGLLCWDGDLTMLFRLFSNSSVQMIFFFFLASSTAGTTGTLLPPAGPFKFLIQRGSKALCGRQHLMNVSFHTCGSTCLLQVFYQLKKWGHV